MPDIVNTITAFTALTGDARRADGTLSQVRGGNQGELAVSEINAKYFEQTMRGNSYVWSVPAAGAVLAALGTASAPFLWNPAGSGKLLVLTKVAAGLVATGTTAAGHIVYGFQNSLGASIGTGAPVVSHTLVAGQNTNVALSDGSGMRFAPTTVLLTAACTFLCSMGLGQATAATTATSPFMAVDDIDGRIIIPPGSAFTVAASGSIASTYSVAIHGYVIPLPNVS